MGSSANASIGVEKMRRGVSPSVRPHAERGDERVRAWGRGGVERRDETELQLAQGV